jgi:hypothetical protein
MLAPAQGDNQELLRELIAASDRTTHAVRAIALPSTNMLVATLVALPSCGLHRGLNPEA